MNNRNQKPTKSNQSTAERAKGPFRRAKQSLADFLLMEKVSYATLCQESSLHYVWVCNFLVIFWHSSGMLLLSSSTRIPRVLSELHCTSFPIAPKQRPLLLMLAAVLGMHFVGGGPRLKNVVLQKKQCAGFSSVNFFVCHIIFSTSVILAHAHSCGPFCSLWSNVKTASQCHCACTSGGCGSCREARSDY